MKKLLCIIVILISQISLAQTQKSVVNWSYRIKKISATEALVTIKATIEPGFHIYSQFLQEGGPIKTLLTFEPADDYELVGKTIESQPIVSYDETFKMDLSYFKNTATFQQKIKLKNSRPQTIKCKLDYSPCSEEICLIPEQTQLDIFIN